MSEGSASGLFAHGHYDFDMEQSLRILKEMSDHKEKNRIMRNLIIAILLFASPCLYAQNQPTFEQALQDAQKGDPSACLWIGFFYATGEGVTCNYTEAIKWLTKAADNKVPSSYNLLGNCYFRLENYQEAIVWYKKAVEDEYTNSNGALSNTTGSLLGICYYRLKNYQEAIVWLKKAIENGDTDSYFWLGRCYSIQQNYQEATVWFKKAIENGDAISYGYLGECYFLLQNYQEAYKWIKMAADNSDIKAYGLLGKMYLYGNGTTKNPNNAFKWTSKAVENGDITSNTILGIMYLNGLGTERNEQKALECFEKSASIEDPIACSWLGTMYMNGTGTSIDYAKGFEWTKKATEKGDVGSYIALGFCFEEGKGIEKNIDKAITWYKKAYDNDVPNAPMMLCHAYYTQKDYGEAKKWANITINQKEYALVGYRILALLNMYGLGMQQNQNKAFELIAKAIDEAKLKGGPMPNTLDVEGELYLASNNISKARDIYNAILKETPDFYAQTETKLSKYMKEHKGGDVDFEMPIASNINDKTFAVIIANEKYQMEKSVEFATNDGKVFMEYCKKTLGLPEKNVHYITDATLNNIKYEVKWLQDVIAVYNGEAKVIFYYAGHGIPNENNKSAYLLPIDGYGSDATTGYALEDLYKALGSLPSKSVTIFLDACFSGAKRDGDMLASARGIAIKTRPTAPIGNMVVFTAAQGDETAYPYKEQEHGLFTYYLLKKLQETKGNVTLGELGDYIKTQVKRQSIVTNGKLQSPTIIATSSVGNDWKSWKLNQ